MKGIDGTRDGWIAAEYLGDGWSLEYGESLEKIEFDSALVDIPVGLPENSTRLCDSAAIKYLSPERHYSVFNCPVREAVYAETYEQACEINESRTGKRISRQAWNIVPKVREADETAQKHKINEAHPEVFFKSIRKESVKHSKNSQEGLEARLEVLKQFGKADSPGSDLPCTEDDAVDAMVLSLGKIFKLKKLPEAPDTDAEGIEMKIMKPETGDLSD